MTGWSPLGRKPDQISIQSVEITLKQEYSEDYEITCCKSFLASFSKASMAKHGLSGETMRSLIAVAADNPAPSHALRARYHKGGLSMVIRSRRPVLAPSVRRQCGPAIRFEQKQNTVSGLA